MDAEPLLPTSVEKVPPLAVVVFVVFQPPLRTRAELPFSCTPGAATAADAGAVGTSATAASVASPSEVRPAQRAARAVRDGVEPGGFEGVVRTDIAISCGGLVRPLTRSGIDRSRVRETQRTF